MREAEVALMEFVTTATAFESVVRAACETYDVTRDEVLSDSRKVRYAEPRMIVAYILRERHGLAMTEIGRLLKRDHSTIYHAYAVIERRMAVDASYREVVDWIAGGRVYAWSEVQRAEVLIDEAEQRLAEAKRLLVRAHAEFVA